MRRAIGIDAGGSKLLMAIVAEDGRVLASARRATGRETTPDKLLELVGACRAELGESASGCSAAGIAFPGLCDHERGIARSSIMFDGWHDVPIADELCRCIGVPTVVDNDANAALHAELYVRGTSTGCVVFVAIGTGIGGACAFNGELWHGASGVAGEIGNMSIDRHGPKCWCGRPGCLNVFASGSAIELEAAASGSTSAAIDRAACSLGFGLGNVVNLLNPSLVVLGGGVAFSYDAFVARVASAAMQAAFPEAANACRFERALAGYEAAAIGAALLGLRARSGE